MTKALSERVTVSLSPAERAKLRKRAERDQRTESWVVRRAVLAYLNGGTK